MPGPRVFHIGNLHGTSIGEAWITDVPGNPFPKAFYRSRGSYYPNYGSGPWFCAAKAASFRSGSKVYEPGYTSNRLGGTSYWSAGYSSFGLGVLAHGAYLTRERINVVYSAFIVENARYSNDRVYVTQRYCSLPLRGGGAVECAPTPQSAIAAALALPGPWTVTERHGGSYHTVDGGFIYPMFSYRNDELDTFEWAADYGVFMNSSASRFSKAYQNAAENLDLSDVNTLANIKDAASALVSVAKFVKNVFQGNFTGIANSIIQSADPRNLWLSYRYVYKTTESDIKDYADTLQRLGDLATVGSTLTVNGHYADDTGSYGCTVKIYTDDVIPKDAVEFLAAIGIEPNAQNLWDMIPYSFVVDWFLHIGDLLHYVESWGDAISLPTSEIWFTYKSEYDNQQVSYRVPGRKLNVPPIYVQKEASQRTINMRLADTISLMK